MQIIGITGISGAGKSTVSEKIAQIKNAEIINADKVVRDLQRKGNKYYEKIVETFGEEVIDKKTGELDRKKLAKLIFYDKEKKEMLDKLTLEFVVPKIKEEAKKVAKEKITLIDAPLLFETGLDKICDITIGVLANKEICIKRICKRDDVSRKTADIRINNQNKNTYFKMKCDYCINNEEDNLEKQINEIFNRKKSIKRKYPTPL